jgi:hypothetical protein
LVANDHHFGGTPKVDPLVIKQGNGKPLVHR